MSEIASKTRLAVFQFMPTYVPTTTVVEYSDGQKFYGFFQHFSDESELLEKGQYRFIPNNNSINFQQELSKTGQANKDYSIIIDLTKIYKSCGE